MLNFALGFHSIPGDEASIFHLSKILGSLQSLLNNIGQAVQINKTGAISEDIAERTSINASLFFQSSFGIQLVAKNHEDLLGDSTITDSIEIFVSLVGASKNISSMQKHLEQLKFDSAENYRIFMKHIRDSGASLKVEWSAANSINRTGSARLSPSEIESALEIVKQVTSEETQDIEIEGELIAGNAKTKHFIMKDINSDKEYRGYISSEALKDERELVLQKVYIATIRAVTKVYLVSKQVTVEYKLLKFSRIFRDSGEDSIDSQQLNIQLASQD